MAAAIRIKFRIFPTPKYLRIRKRVRPKEVMNPLLVLPKTREKVKSKLKKIRTKNKGRTPNCSGSTK